MQQVAIDALEYLFEGHVQNGGTPIFNISEIIERHNADPHDVGRYLVHKGWVENPRFFPNAFAASISMAGILQIRPGYINDNVMHVLRTINENPNHAFSIMEVLSLQPKDFQIAHKFAILMKEQGWIDARFIHNDVHVQITMQGQNVLQGN